MTEHVKNHSEHSEHVKNHHNEEALESCGSKKDACCSKDFFSKIKHMALFPLLVLNLILSIFILFSSNSSNSVYEAIEKMEMTKIGGKENYEIAKKVMTSPGFIDYQKQSLESMLSQIQISEKQPNSPKIELPSNSANSSASGIIK